MLDAEDVFLTPAEAGAAGALVIAIEIGLLTPPVGLTCYVVKSTLDDPDITLGDIFQGAFPFVPIMLAVTILLVLIPKLSLVFV